MREEVAGLQQVQTVGEQPSYQTGLVELQTARQADVFDVRGDKDWGKAGEPGDGRGGRGGAELPAVLRDWQLRCSGNADNI